MTRWLVLLRALPLTFTVYLVNTLFAVGLATSLGMELERALGFPLGRPTARVAAIESIAAMLPLLRAKAVDLVIAGAMLLLLSPWLQMAWLTALSALHGPTGALRSAWSLYFRALLTTLLVTLCGAIALLPWAGLSYAVHAFSEGRFNDRVHDLSIVVAASPAIVSLLVTIAWHDLARARCLSSGAFRSTLLALLDAIRPSVLLRYVVWSGTGLLLVIGAQAWAFHVQNAGFVGGFFLLALLQGAAFTRSLLRSAWLADALACVDAAAERRRKARA